MKYFLLFFAFAIVISSCENISRYKKTLDEKSVKKAFPKKKSGLRKQRYPNGNLRSSVNYKDDIREGDAKSYYDNGQVKLTMTYKDGKKEGKSIFYRKNGKLYRESNYKIGQLDGIRTVFSNDKIKAKIPYKKGKPGIGLKEYLVNGKLKTSYPKIIVKPIDNRQSSGKYILDIYFSKTHPKDEFYMGELLDGKFVHDGLMRLSGTKGHGIFKIPIMPGVFIMKKMKIIGVHNTLQGNPYVTTRTYNLSIG